MDRLSAHVPGRHIAVLVNAADGALVHDVVVLTKHATEDTSTGGSIVRVAKRVAGHSAQDAIGVVRRHPDLIALGDRIQLEIDGRANCISVFSTLADIVRHCRRNQSYGRQGAERGINGIYAIGRRVLADHAVKNGEAPSLIETQVSHDHVRRIDVGDGGRTGSVGLT